MGDVALLSPILVLPPISTSHAWFIPSLPLLEPDDCASLICLSDNDVMRFGFLRPDWYGMLYSQADSKKKSNLMMSLFEPGPEPLPWLGKMSQLGPILGEYEVGFPKPLSPYFLNIKSSLWLISGAEENPYGEDDSRSPFPLQPRTKRSYAQNVTVWIKPSGLQVGTVCHCMVACRFMNYQLSPNWLMIGHVSLYLDV